MRLEGEEDVSGDGSGVASRSGAGSMDVLERGDLV